MAYGLFIIVSTFIASLSQILLKISANNPNHTGIYAYLNIHVIVAYSLFLLSTFFSVYALKYIPISISAFLGTSSYFFVIFFSYIILKEKISKNMLIGLFFILLGIIIVNI